MKQTKRAPIISRCNLSWCTVPSVSTSSTVDQPYQLNGTLTTSCNTERNKRKKTDHSPHKSKKRHKQTKSRGQKNHPPSVPSLTQEQNILPHVIPDTPEEDSPAEVSTVSSKDTDETNSEDDLSGFNNNVIRAHSFNVADNNLPLTHFKSQFLHLFLTRCLSPYFKKFRQTNL